MGQRPHSARRVSLLNSITHELQRFFNNRASATPGASDKDGFAARVSVAERILGLRATLRTASTDLERCPRCPPGEMPSGIDDAMPSRGDVIRHRRRSPMACEPTAELETARGDSSHASFLAKKQAL